MNKFTLGIVGGCLSHQPGIGLSHLYTTRLKKKMAEAHQIILKFRISRDFDLPFADRVALLAKGINLDAVLIHVRSPFVHQTALFQTLIADDRITYHIHPQLAKRGSWIQRQKQLQSLWSRAVLTRRRKRTSDENSVAQLPWRPGDAPASVYDAPPQFKQTKIFGCAIRDLFYVAGILSGLDNWAVDEELRKLDNAIAACQRMGLRPLLLGPGRRPDNRWEDRMCRKVDSRLSTYSASRGVPYCSICELKDDFGHHLLLADGHHFSSEGHSYVANQLETRVLELIP